MTQAGVERRCSSRGAGALRRCCLGRDPKAGLGAGALGGAAGQCGGGGVSPGWGGRLERPVGKVLPPPGRVTDSGPGQD